MIKKNKFAAPAALLLCFGAVCCCGGSPVEPETSDAKKVISSFEIYRNGELAYDYYEIDLFPDGYAVSVNGGSFRSMDERYIDELLQVIEEYDLYQWDGFDRSRENVLDGEGFRLEVVFTDGTSIQAIGDNAFPENYHLAVSDIQDILDGIEMPADDVRIVGTDVRFEDITDFYYTYDASFYPPQYQRYRFYVEEGKPMFYHETREGGGWPQTEEDITASGQLQLSEEEWNTFCRCIEGGTVHRREESLEDGDAGPWLYLYWSDDQGEYQEFNFASWEKMGDFEALCEALRGSTEQE